MMKQKVDQPPFAGEWIDRIGRMRSDMTAGQVVGHVVIWLLITIFTFGIGGLFWPYAALKLIIESVVIADESTHTNARLRCDIKLGEQLGHAVIWLVLILVTGGIAAPCYLFAVAHTAISRTELVSA